MAVTIGVLEESREDETRVALTPEVAAKLAAQGVRVVVQRGAGTASRIPDEAWEEAEVLDDAAAVLAACDVLATVQPPPLETVRQLGEGAVLAGLLQPHQHPDIVKALRDGKITAFAMELIPRISRAQGMDVLSSQASVAGYKAVLIAAGAADKFFPMLTTAAGTIRPAGVLVIGAGVAGLQAIATAKRLGAVVQGYDVRAATREQVESLGAKFVDTGVSAEGEGGYARELTDEEKEKQQEVLEQHIERADVVITTAAVPGRQAPRIISADTVSRMKPGAVIVDLAAESGGNCELTRPGETVESKGVQIIGPVNVPATVPRHASEMYARNVLNFLSPALADGELSIDWEDEVFAGAVLTHDGEIRHEPTRERLAGEAT